MSFSIRETCRFCGLGLIDILHLGDNFPLAGGFLRSLCEIKDEKVYPLTVSYCKSCCLMQCKQVVDSDILFKRGYFYYSSMIPALVRHFSEYAEHLSKLYQKTSDTLVLEIGCNDGVFLRPLKARGFRVIGVDPSDTVKDLIKDGYDIYNTYLDLNTVRKILEAHGQVDLFLSSNSFAHIDNMQDVMKCLKLVLKPGGLAIIEVHYAKSIIENLNFDFIYHEHMSYYTVTSFENISGLYGMTVEKVEETSIHGGSIRVYLRNRVQEVSQDVRNILDSESRYRVLDTYRKFSSEVENWKEKFMKLYSSLRKSPVKIYGYGSSGRANTICTYTNLDIDEIIDDAQSKIGTFMPVSHKEIKSSEIIRTSPPDYIIILAWPYANDIIQKVRKFYSGKFIIPLPDIQIIDG